METGDVGVEIVDGAITGTSTLRESGEGSMSLGDALGLEGKTSEMRLGIEGGGTDELGLLLDSVAETVETSVERRGERKVKRGNGSSAGV